MSIFNSLPCASLCLLCLTFAAHAQTNLNQLIEQPGQYAGSSGKPVSISDLPVDTQSLSESLQLTAATNKAIKEVKVEMSSKSRGVKESAIFEQIAEGTVLIVSSIETKDGTVISTGSGALITQKGHVVTNQHVVGDSRYVYIYFKPIGKTDLTGSRGIRGEVIKVDASKDLALVKIDTVPSSARPIALSNTLPKVGEDVHAVGHPRSQYWTYTKGYVSAVRDKYQWPGDGETMNEATVIQTQTPINPGNSGGPLVSDSRRLVGINSFGRLQSEGLNYAVAVDEVKQFLSTPESKLPPSPQKVVAAAPQKAPKCGKEIVNSGTKQDMEGPYDFVAFDIQCKGKIDAVMVMPHAKNKPQKMFMDTNGDGKWDIVVISNNRNGKWDISYHDTNHSGKFNMIGQHPDGNLIATKLEPIS